MRRSILIGAATLLAVPVLGFAQTTTPTPRTQVLPSTPPAAGHPVAVDPASLHNGIRSSKVVGSSVYNEARDDVGKVDDIILPAGGGVPVAIISVGGFLGMGTRYVAVPLSDLHLANNRWTLPHATKEYLKTLPPFTYDNTPTRG